MNKNLHDWVFHFNVYTNKWNAAKRENAAALFSGPKDKVLSSSDIHTLVHIITKTNGDAKKIKEFLAMYEPKAPKGKVVVKDKSGKVLGIQG